MKVGTVPLPPIVFPSVNTKTMPAGTVLHRTHASTFRAGEFNPCMGQSTRFAPLDDIAGLCVPSLYAATSREAAAYESIFHDVPANARFKTVRLSSVRARSVSRIKLKKDLAVACLFAPDLKMWGLARTNLIETSKATYAKTVRWARALHTAYPKIDGLIWTSRQCDPDTCLVFFGGRVQEADFDIVDCVDVSTSPSLLLELRNHGRRSGITII